MKERANIKEDEEKKSETCAHVCGYGHKPDYVHEQR